MTVVNKTAVDAERVQYGGKCYVHPQEIERAIRELDAKAAGDGVVLDWQTFHVEEQRYYDTAMLEDFFMYRIEGARAPMTVLGERVPWMEDLD